MTYLPSMGCAGRAGMFVLAVALAPATSAHTLQGADTPADAEKLAIASETSTNRRPSALPRGLPFATTDDERAFREIARRASLFPIPAPHHVAKEFLAQRLGIDGDGYVVAHFATTEQRANGKPDNVIPLTDALIEAFPDHDRHGWFAELSDMVGGLNGGGASSPGIVATAMRVAHGKSAADVFSALGKLLWSRTGPGYIYNTFIASGNVVETFREDHWPLDEAFGIYAVGGFDANHASPIRLSQVVEAFAVPSAFAELPYVTRLTAELDAYWARTRADWPLLARYEFVMQARHARDTGLLTAMQYRMVMQAAAPKVPREGAVTLEALRQTPDGTGQAFLFDINGYAASDLVRFVAPDKSEIMYVPGESSPFVVVRDEAALRQWVLTQAKDPAKLTRLLAHFSEHDAQDGLFWTGVKHGLENLGSGRWRADSDAVDHADRAIVGDVFEAMRTQAEARFRSDATVQASTAWDAWRSTLNRTVTLLAPLGYVPALAVPLQAVTGLASVGIGVEQAIDGRTEAERLSGVEQAVSTVVTNVPLGALFGGEMRGAGQGETKADGSPSFVYPQRVHGKIGYPLGPTRPPSWPAETVDRIYARDDGRLGLWMAADLRRHTRQQLPPRATHLGDGTYIQGGDIYVPWRDASRVRLARLVHSESGYRMALSDDTPGPLVERGSDGLWQFAEIEQNYLPGSLIAHRVAGILTADPRVLAHAAEVLEQFGVSESSPAVTGIGPDADAGEPLLKLSVGHGFIETLSARLRDPTAKVWTPTELRLIAPILAEATRRPFALSLADGRLVIAVLPDGREVTEGVPATALRVEIRGDKYVVLGPRLPDTDESYTSVFSAFERQYRRLATREQMVDPAQREHLFRTMLADMIDARGTRPELERMHRYWIDGLRLATKHKERIKALSNLRYALANDSQSLTSEQIRQIDDVRDVLPNSLAADVTDSRLLAAGVMARIVERQSALLPPALAHLTVRDPDILRRARAEIGDEFGIQDSYYVKLRHPDGRMQVVKVNLNAAATGYELLAPGDATNRATGYYLVERDGMWRPEQSLADGFVLVDPGEFIATTLAVGTVLPVDIASDLQSVMGIVDAIPQPLLRFFSRSLTGAEIAADGGVVLTLRHPTSGAVLRYATHVDRHGQPIASAPPAAAIDVDALPFIDQHVTQHVPAPTRQGVSPPAPFDSAAYRELVRTGQPISAFFGGRFADLHVSALVKTRRLRGMLREDSHMALVGAAADHLVTLVLPVGEDALRMVGAERSVGRPLNALPPGTLIVDSIYGAMVRAEHYAAFAREVARGWEAAGWRVTRLEPDGREVSESPIAFTERMLSTPITVNLWNPEHDPLSERRYVDYARRRYAGGLPVRHAGLDWLVTREARRDYLSYFQPDTMAIPFADDAPAHDPVASNVRGLAETAVAAGLTSGVAPGI